MSYEDDTPPQITSKWPRTGGLRLKLPNTVTEATTEESNRLTDPLPLEPVIHEIMEKQNGIDRVEILTWPDEDGQIEWILVPETSGRPSLAAQKEKTATKANNVDDENDNENNDSDDEDATKFAVSTSATHTKSTSNLKAVLDACKNHLPAGIGYDRCDVDLSPIETIIRPTCRLIVRESSDLAPLARKNPHPIAALITDLTSRDIPYLLQTIITKAISKSHDYELSQRLAVYPPQYGIGLEEDFAHYLEQGPVVNVSDYYDKNTSRVRSNFDLDGSDYFSVQRDENNRPTVKRRHKHGKEAAEAAREILEGKNECYDLYGGYHDTKTKLERLYSDVSYYSKIALNKSDLRAFILFVPEYIPYSPWNKVQYVDPPDIISQPLEIPDGAQISTDKKVRSTTEPTLATQGGPEHQHGVAFVYDYFNSRGFDIEVLDDGDTDSVPDLRMRKDGITHAVEVEKAGLSRPANVLTNAGRAKYYDLNVMFVTSSKADAQKIVKILRHPVRANTDNGAQLYTYSTALTLEDGGKPVLPANESSSKWYLLSDGTLELRANGECLASGPASKSMREFDFAEVIKDGPVPQNQSRVHGAFVPSEISFLQDVDIYYRNGDQITKLQKDDYPTSWDYTDQEGKRKRYEAAFGKFVEQKMIYDENSEIRKQEVFSAVMEDFYKPQTSRKAPGAGEQGKALWKHVEKKPKKDNTIDVIKNHTWRWPHNIESPDRPFVGQNDINLKDWE